MAGSEHHSWAELPPRSEDINNPGGTRVPDIWNPPSPLGSYISRGEILKKDEKRKRVVQDYGLIRVRVEQIKDLLREPLRKDLRVEV